MILFTNGCSWTWGGGLEPYHENDDAKRTGLLWPAHLGNKLGAREVVNLSWGCSSNQRIVRTTYDWFLKKYQGEEIIAVIQWTEPSRYEYYVTEDPLNDFSNTATSWALIKSDLLLIPDHNLSNKLKDDRLHTYTDIEGMYRSITHYAALDNLFKTFNVKYYYWFFKLLLPYGSPEVYIDFVRKNYNFLIKDQLGCYWEYDRVSPTDNHPSIEGHRELADIIYKAMKSQ